MKDLGEAKKILGMSIDRNKDKGYIKVHQISYLEKLITKFSMNDCKPVQIPLAAHFNFSDELCPKTDIEREQMKNIPYSNAIGSLMYSMVSTRPDLSFAISVLSRYMSNPGKPHWQALKWVFRYIKGTLSIGLIYKRKNKDLWLEGFIDSDYAGHKDNRRSTTAYMFCINDCCISWKSQLQPIVALSTTETEYIAATEAINEAIWLQGLLQELKMWKEKAVVYFDSQSAIHLCKNHVFHERTKHVDVRYHFIREKVTNGVIKVDKVSSEV
ncbi:hypothetical protein UlMin_003385 [Ulmus minor]